MYVKNLTSGNDSYAGDEGAPDTVDLVNGGAGDDTISGGLDADTLNGQDGDDLLDGGVGNDILDGGDGDDTSVFSGAAGDYVWSGDRTSATITGPDGTDTLANIEHLRFGSTVIDLPAPNTAPGAPTDGDAAANTAPENAANGAVVANLTLGAVDPDAGQTLTYSLLDDAGGRFAIDAATGAVTVADSTKLNFETAASHQITVQVSDGVATSSASFTINVTNVAPTAPADTDTAANTLAEGAANGAAAGLTVGATDVNGGALTYSLLDNAGGRFAIDAATGVVTVADSTKLNFEAAASHQITVQVSDGTATSSASFTIDVTNVTPGAPADTNVAANTVSENATNGAVVAGLAITAAEPNGGVAYSLVDDAGGRFAINAATGVVTVANAGLLDHDTTASHQITVRASDGTSAAATDTTFTIDVTNAPPSAPADADGTANTVSEDASNGALVGITASATEVGAGTVSYSLSNDAGGRFAIDATTGVVTVADATKLNFETATSHQITVRATDGQGAFSSQAFTIAVTNVANDAPQDTDPAANTISEGAANGDIVTGLAITTPDVNGGPLTYSLLDNAGGRFTINAATGVVTVADATKLNFESATSHEIVVQAASGDTVASSSFTIVVTNVAPPAPIDSNPAANTVSEKAANGAVVAGLAITSADPNGGVTYSLTNDAGGRFAINATTGVVTVINASLLDADVLANHTITVQASDGMATSSSDLVITLVDQIDNYWTGTTGADTYTVTATDIQDWQLDGLAGNDTLTGGAGEDVLIGGAGADKLTGGNGNDTLDGGADNDTLTGGNGDDVFLVGVGTGTDSFDGGAGFDTIRATADNTVVSFSLVPGVEAISAGGFANVTIGGTTGDDSWNFSAWTVDSTIVMTGGLGNDTITGTAGADTIRGDDGNDSLNGGGGNDTIIGGAGGDSLSGGAGDDVFLIGVGAGTDYFDGNGGYDTIKASADNAVISFSQVFGMEAISAGGFANVTIGGTTGDDSWNFSGWTVDSAVTMSGGLGNDTITGSAGADTIRGDEGNDNLTGGAGDDTFLIGANSGGDAIEGGLGFDTIKATANNAVISLSFVNAVEAISSNGFSNVTVTGTAGNDTLYFNAIAAGGITVNGLAGNDLITGSAGADNIKGDIGLDVLNGGGGDDILDGGADVDNMNGNDGNDTVIGGAGNDTLYGGAGDDVFLVGVGSGMDAFDGGTGYDIIKATADNTVFTFNGPSQFVAIEQLSAGGFKNVTIVGTTGNDEMHFNGLASIDGMPISTGAGADSVDGSQSADNIKSEAGADTVFGWGGDDIIDGGTEADHLNGNDGNDTIIGGAGNDLLYGGAGDDVFLIGLGAGTDAFDGGTGYDVVKATADNTAISFSTVTALEAFSAGGFANVTIVGTTGNDDWNFTNFVVDSTIVISTGAGNDIIMGSAGADTIRGDGGNDSLSGGAGDDVFLIGAGAGSDAFNGGTGYDTIKATADNVAIGITSIVGIEAFSSGGFANVSIVGSSVADDMNFTGVLTTGGMVIDGLGGDDKITGTNDVDTLKGGTGNDTIYGLDGNDVIDGGVGLDTLYGGNGDDTFLVGADTAGVVDNYDGGAGTDTVRATANNVAIGVSGMTGIEVFSSGGFTNVTVAGSNNADTLNFTGKTLDGVVVAGLAGNDTITGTNVADTIRGDAGTDTLYGGDGDDILDGGTENDALFGGAGDDVLLVGASPGTDSFDGGAGFDEVRANVAGAVIYFSTLTSIEKIGSGGFANVQIALQSSSSLANWDFTNIQLEGITRITGGLQNDTIIGSQGDDVIYGYNGSDQLFGGLGDDTFIYSGVPSGNPYTDTVDGGAGWDKLLALGASSMILVSSMTGIEEISTGGFSGVVLGGNWVTGDTIDLRGVVITGNLSVDLSGGDDVFYGASGFNGGTAVDIVNGGTGNDYIDTGDGDDIIQVSFNNGLDTIHGGDGYDKIVHVGGGNVNLLFNFDGIEEVAGNGVSLLKIVGTAGDDSIDMRGVVLTQVQYITGDLGNDTIYGSYGNDFIMGDRGFDTIYGDSGDDLIWFTAYGDTDTVDGGEGYDTLAAWNDGVIIGVTGLTNIEAISGQNHANVGLAFTNDYDNIDLTGLAVSGIAYIDLKAGDDIFVGTAGADRIIGGLGADYMTGGAGADIFDFNSAAEAGYGANGISFDEIADFVRGVDKIDLSTIDATPAYAQTDAFTFIGTAAFTGSAGQLRYTSYGWNGFCEVEGDLNGDGIGDFRIRVGGGVSDLSASDFFL